jgi:ATP-dependent helicase/nuclease subunit A
MQAARNAVLASAQSDDAPALGAALRDVAGRVSADDFDKLLNQLLAKRAELRPLFAGEAGLAVAEALLRIHLSLGQGDTRESLARSVPCDTAGFLAVAEALDGGTKTEKANARRIREACAGGSGSLLDLRDLLLTKQGEARGNIAYKKMLDARPWIGEFLAKEQERLLEALGRMGDLECLSATLSVLRLGGAILGRFEEEKRRRGAYDFEDLIVRTGALLRERPDAAWVLYKLDGGIEHLLVDEAQDTSPMQWEIIRSLTDEFFAGEGRHGRRQRSLFVVGDRKQSIYSFQGADPNVFEQVLDGMKARAEDAGQEFRAVDFSVSFRSAPRILEAVDVVFAPGSDARKGLDGTAAARDWHHEPNRRDAEGIVEIWALIEPEEKEEPQPWQAPVDREPANSARRRLAKALAGTISGWIGRRLLAGHGRPVAAGDILILVKSRNGFFDAMIRALWNARVPVAGADRLVLGENIAVLDLIALAQFALMPEDDHALACILKSPVLPEPLSEEQLMDVAAGRGGLSLWQIVNQHSGEVYASAARFLRPLVSGAPAARPFEFFSGVLTGARLRFVSRLGSEANDAIDALLGLALDYEETHGTSISGFVNWFEAGETEIKRNMEQGGGEVRVMTVHGAKGLEAPIVILPDTAGGHESSRTDPLIMLDGFEGAARVPLWPAPRLKITREVETRKAWRKDIELAEYRRLLYVAMTRARDELYVCGYSGKRAPPEACWYNTILSALRDRMTPLGDGRGWRMGEAPREVAEAGEAEVRQGPAWPDWIGRELEQAATEVPESGPPPRSPGGVRRGILIHRILQNLPDVPEGQRPAHVAAAVRRAGADPSIAARLMALLDDPVLAGLLSGRGHSEASLIIQPPGGGPPERRRIDRLLITPEEILVADYKTDRAVPDRPEDCSPDYLMQLAIYRDTLRLVQPGLPMRFCIVWTETPELMPIPDSLLDRMAALRPPQP